MGKLSLKPRAFHLALKLDPRLFGGRLGPHQVSHSLTRCSAAGRATPRTDGWHTQLALPHSGLTEGLDSGMCGNRCGRRGSRYSWPAKLVPHLSAGAADLPGSPYFPSVDYCFWLN